MPEKVHDCVDHVKGDGKSEDSAWAICNSIEETNNKFLKETNISFFKLQEHHNPLDIPFGHEVKEGFEGFESEPNEPPYIKKGAESPFAEVNMNPKDPEGTEEGGLGSGRQDEGGGSSGGSQAGPLISFGEMLALPHPNIIKEMMDAKLNCPCQKNSK